VLAASVPPAPPTFSLRTDRPGVGTARLNRPDTRNAVASLRYAGAYSRDVSTCQSLDVNKYIWLGSYTNGCGKAGISTGVTLSASSSYVHSTFPNSSGVTDSMAAVIGDSAM
jgi:hypothetical protein